MPEFHEILKKIRTERHLTQENMSKLLGLNRSTYSLYESGRREPNIEVLKRISKILNLTLDELTGWREHDLAIDSEIDRLIKELGEKDLSHSEVLALTKKIRNLSEEQQKIDKKRDAALLSNHPTTIAAHFDGDEYTEEELDEIRKFAEFVKSKRKDAE